ncbi:MAG: phosphoenolpyruvate--protein phosphotransferase [Myxococcota bacterium]
MQRFRGIAASPGVAYGPAYLVDRRRLTTPQQHISSELVPREIERLRAAVYEADQQLERIKAKLEARDGDEHHGILDAYQLILHDDRILEAAERKIALEQINAEWAVRRAVEDLKVVFDEIADEYFRGRLTDVEFVSDRILRNLLGRAETTTIPPGCVIVAHDISPADAALLWRTGAVAFATDAGGIASHTAIMARSLQVPAIVGLDRLSEIVGIGDVVVVDGTTGEVILDPPPRLLAEYETRRRRDALASLALLAERHLPAQTLDGRRMTLYANIELPEEMGSALAHGAEGIGLFRTEFLFMNRPDLPTEDEHLFHAAAAIERLAGRPATFRTFDLGADKVALTFDVGPQKNPALGLRSMRLCLREPALLRTQLRGLLRASPLGPMQILFPMISGIEELRAARAVLDEARESLAREGQAVAEVRLGVMIEMPSAAIIADLIARECDFLSIGTNDLIQFSLAVDRASEQVSYLYDPLHPAILRMLRSVVEAGHAAGKPVCVCGEVAGDPLLALLLLGMDVDELSMNAAAIPRVKRVLRAWRASEAKELVAEVMRADTSTAVQAILRART